MDDGLVKNTLAFWFPPGAPSPSLVEVARFVKELDADLDSMETSYKLSEERCLCVKFKSYSAMKEALEQNPEIRVFRYSKGERVEVKMTVAGSCARYVRIFDLHPEIPDSEVSALLSKYGEVKRMVREKFPADLGLNMFTGVRGVYLEVKKEVPSALYVRNRKARIYYEGLKRKCFLCKEEGHLKADCPQKGNKGASSSVQSDTGDLLESRDTDTQSLRAGVEENIQQTGQAIPMPSFSGVVSGTKPQTTGGNFVAKMVTLVSERNKTPVPQAPAVGSEQMDTGEEETGKSAVKRQHSSGESGDTDEDVLPGFTKVEANRKSSRLVKKPMTPLEVISSASTTLTKAVKNKRSSSK